MIIAVLSIAFFAVFCHADPGVARCGAGRARNTIRDMVEATVQRSSPTTKTRRKPPDRAGPAGVKWLFCVGQRHALGRICDDMSASMAPEIPDAGVTYVHTNPKYVNVKPLDFRTVTASS